LAQRLARRGSLHSQAFQASEASIFPARPPTNQVFQDSQPAIKLAIEPDIGPTIEQAIKPAIEQAIKPAIEQAIKPAIEQALKPALEPASYLASYRPASYQASQLSNQQATKPARLFKQLKVR